MPTFPDSGNFPATDVKQRREVERAFPPITADAGI